MSNISEKYLQEIKKAFGTEEEFQAFINSCQLPLKKSIKINLHKISPEEFTQETQPDWRKLTNPWFINEKDSIIPVDVFYVDRQDTQIPLWKTFRHQSWFFYIQEVAAWMPARFLFNSKNLKKKSEKGWKNIYQTLLEDTFSDFPSELILDISAAPGGKSVQLWDYLQYLYSKFLQNSSDTLQTSKLWFIVSNDVNKSRILALAHNLNRMGIFNSWITAFNWFAFWKNLPETFDKVLVDAPCSGEGTGFKSDFSLKFWKKEEINKISWTQFQLLVSALKTVKPWWIVVYSTCTMNPYENEFNVKKILEFFKGAVILEDVKIIDKSPGIESWDWQQILSPENAKKLARFWPHIQKTWWFFIAKFKKRETLNLRMPAENKLAPKYKNKINYDKSLQKKMFEFAKENWGIELDPNQHFFVETSSQIYLTSPKWLEVKNLFHFERIWTPVFKKDKRWNIRPNHHFGSILGHLATKNFIEIDKNTSQKYALGNDLEKSEILKEYIDWNPPMWYVVIKYKKWWLGVGKLTKEGIKNKYIKN